MMLGGAAGGATHCCRGFFKVLAAQLHVFASIGWCALRAGGPVRLAGLHDVQQRALCHRRLVGVLTLALILFRMHCSGQAWSVCSRGVCCGCAAAYCNPTYSLMSYAAFTFNPVEFQTVGTCTSLHLSEANFAFSSRGGIIRRKDVVIS